MKAALLIAALVLVFSSVHASAIEIPLSTSLMPIADTYVAECDPATNFGSSNFLNVVSFLPEAGGMPGECVSGTGNREVLIRFLVPRFGSGVTITGATLTLYRTLGGSGTETRTYLAQRVTESWSESAVVWDTKPTTTSAGQASLSVNLGSSLSYDTYTVTNIITSWQSQQNYGFRVVDSSLNNASAAGTVYLSRETFVGEQKGPWLNISYQNDYLNFGANAAIVFAFIGTLTLTLIGASWIRNRRGGIT